MPPYAPDKDAVFGQAPILELIRQGHKGAAAARMVGVSTSCGSLWFIDAGSVVQPDQPISPRFLNQDDRIAIADGLQAGDPVKVIATKIGKSYQTVYREIARNSKPDGSYQPWWAHNHAFEQRQRPKTLKLNASAELRLSPAELKLRWSPQQIARFLARTYPNDASMRLSAEAIYQGLFAGRLGKKKGKLRTGRLVRRKQRRGVAPPKVRQRISGCLRALTAAQEFAAIRSYTATSIKRPHDLFAGLALLTKGSPWVPHSPHNQLTSYRVCNGRIAHRAALAPMRFVRSAQ